MESLGIAYHVEHIFSSTINIQSLRSALPIQMFEITQDHMYHKLHWHISYDVMQNLAVLKCKCYLIDSRAFHRTEDLLAEIF